MLYICIKFHESLMFSRTTEFGLLSYRADTYYGYLNFDLDLHWAGLIYEVVHGPYTVFLWRTNLNEQSLKKSFNRLRRYGADTNS